MTTGATTLLGLALPVDGELDGTWGDVVNYGITDYVDIAVAGTLTLTGDGAVTLANTTGTASGTNIGATTAQYAVIKIAGTLTATKVVTAPSYSKTYIVDNTTATYGVTFKASGQTGVTVAAGEKCTVYYNGADYVKVASSVTDGVSTISFGSTGLTPSTATAGAVTVAGTLAVLNGGTGVTTSTGSGNAVLSTSPTLVTPILGTPTSATLTNATGLPLTTGVSGILPIANGGTATATPALVAGSGVSISGTWPNQTISATGSGGTITSVTASSPLASSGGTTPNITITSSTGSGAVVLATSPTLTTPVLGTPSSGTLSSCTVDGTNSVGYKTIPQNSESVDYTLVLADSGKYIYHPSTDANARTFTIPANSSVAYPIGTAISFVNMSTNALTIAITSDTMYLSTGATGSRTLAQYGSATALKMTSTTWLITGSNLT
jgi:hypothetical protein